MVTPCTGTSRNHILANMAWALPDAAYPAINHVVDGILKDHDGWITLVDQCSQHISDIQCPQGILLFQTMLEMLHLEVPTDVDVMVELLLATFALKLVVPTTFIQAALGTLNLTTMKGITKVKTHINAAVTFYHHVPKSIMDKLHKSPAQPSSIGAGRPMHVPAAPADHLPDIVSMLKDIQATQQAQAIAITAMQDGTPPEEPEDPPTNAPSNEILSLLVSIQKEQHQQGQQIVALQSSQMARSTAQMARGPAAATAMSTLNDVLALDPIQASTNMEVSMHVSHPQIHYFNEKWLQLGAKSSSQRAILLDNLKKKFECVQPKLNHQRDTLLQVVEYLIMKDPDAATKLIADRLHFLKFLDQHPVHEAVHYYEQLRGAEKPQRFKAAECSTQLLSKGLPHKQAAYYAQQQGVPLPNDAGAQSQQPTQQGGGGRGQPGGGPRGGRRGGGRRPW